MQKWQPIETAPKDGANILLWWNKGVYLGYWLDNAKKAYPWAGWRTHGMHALLGQPSHWLPVPDPPE